MTLRLSTGARNLMFTQGFAGVFNKGSIGIYSGSQPATADAAPTGTKLGIVTISSGALTQETRATGSLTITAAAGGSVNTVTVGGLNIIPDGAVAAVPGDLTATALAVATAINRNGIMEASASGAVVTLKGRPGTGVTTAAVSATLTTVTASYVNMGSGVAGVAPVNGLYFDVPAGGLVARPTGVVWSFSGIAAGVAGYFRLIGSAADSEAVSTTLPRLDGSIATSGGDMGLSNITVAIGAPNTVDRFNVTQPANV